MCFKIIALIEKNLYICGVNTEVVISKPCNGRTVSAIIFYYDVSQFGGSIYPLKLWPPIKTSRYKVASSAESGIKCQKPISYIILKEQYDERIKSRSQYLAYCTLINITVLFV